jgi:hypothetical protein
MSVKINISRLYNARELNLNNSNVNTNYRVNSLRNI